MLSTPWTQTTNLQFCSLQTVVQVQDTRGYGATTSKHWQRQSHRELSHLSDWFQLPITAEEMNVDALAGQNHVKRTKYDPYQMTWQKGKKRSEDDIKNRWQFISIRYWGNKLLEAVEDELISCLGTDNNQQAIQGYFKFNCYYLTLQQLLLHFLLITGI